jgi:hypothetical protein
MFESFHKLDWETIIGAIFGIIGLFLCVGALIFGTGCLCFVPGTGGAIGCLSPAGLQCYTVSNKEERLEQPETRSFDYEQPASQECDSDR